MTCGEARPPTSRSGHAWPSQADVQTRPFSASSYHRSNGSNISQKVSYLSMARYTKTPAGPPLSAPCAYRSTHLDHAVAAIALVAGKRVDALGLASQLGLTVLRRPTGQWRFKPRLRRPGKKSVACVYLCELSVNPRTAAALASLTPAQPTVSIHPCLLVRAPTLRTPARSRAPRPPPPRHLHDPLAQSGASTAPGSLLS